MMQNHGHRQRQITLRLTAAEIFKKKRRKTKKWRTKKKTDFKYKYLDDKFIIKQQHGMGML
jgi:hypothetical protein